MFTHVVFWMWFAGVVFLAAGLVSVRKELISASSLDKLIALGPVFVAAPLAVFGTEHFVLTRDIMQLVPAWMPARLFVTYLVGCGLIATATSLVARKFVRLSATMLGVMFFLFVLLMDIPATAESPREWLGWTLALREAAFAGGAWALAGSLSSQPPARKRNWMVLIGRFFVTIAVIFYGVEQLLRPAMAPGVPDSKLTPAWVPLHAWWGYPVGAFMLVAGLAMLLNKKARTAAAGVGLVMVLIAVLLHVPILALAQGPSEMIGALNFIFDTLLFGGTVLLVARAMPAEG